MKNKPQVSIIIPNYNYSHFLEERFNSILNQSYDDYEIIFLDDASQDNSLELVNKKYRKYIHKLKVNQSNSGNPFIQWNRGVKLAEGSYLWIAEADDTCEPTFLEASVNILEKNPSIGLAYCLSVPINVDGKVIDSQFYQSYVQDLDSSRWLEDFFADGRHEVRQYLGCKNTITNVSGVLFRNDAYISSGYAPEEMRMCGDWMVYCKILYNWDIAFISQPLNYHRQHPVKHTQNSVLNLTYFEEFLKVQKYIKSTFSLNEDETKLAFYRFINEWDRLTVSSYGRIGLKKTISLALMGLKNYPKVNYYPKILKHLMVNILKSIESK